MIKVSEELLNDSVFDLESYIAREFARRIGTKRRKPSLPGTVPESLWESWLPLVVRKPV